MKIGSLCTGYGGLDLAVEAHFNAETIWCAEFDKYASQVIEKRFGIPNYGDIKKIDWNEVPEIDILTAGYPCQPFSTAGSRKGTNDSRHIWPYIQKAIGILEPRLIILENVRGHLSLGFKEVLQGLAECGYDARWQIVRASDAGAPHQRARLFIIAYSQSRWTRCKSSGIQAQNPGSGSSGSENLQCPHTHSLGFCLGEQDKKWGQGKSQSLASRMESDIFSREIPDPLENSKLNPKYVEYMMGLPHGWVTDCEISRAQQLKMLGNGVVPQQAKLALEILTDGI